jgi:hypothetical protein
MICDTSASSRKQSVVMLSDAVMICGAIAITIVDSCPGLISPCPSIMLLRDWRDQAQAGDRPDVVQIYYLILNLCGHFKPNMTLDKKGRKNR